MAAAYVLVSSAVTALAQDQPPILKPKPRPAATASILVVCDLACNWSLDGELQGSLSAGGSKKVTVSLGQHLLHAITTGTEHDEADREVDLKTSAQTIVRLELQPVRNTRLAAEQNDRNRAEQQRRDRAARQAPAQPQPEQVPARSAAPAPSIQSKFTFATKISDNLFVLARLDLLPEEWAEFDRNGGSFTAKRAHRSEKKVLIVDGNGLRVIGSRDGQPPHAVDDGHGNFNLVGQEETSLPCYLVAQSVRFPGLGTIEIGSIRYFSTNDVNDEIRASASKFCEAQIP